MEHSMRDGWARFSQYCKNEEEFLYFLAAVEKQGFEIVAIKQYWPRALVIARQMLDMSKMPR